jgi:hypothetical protein
MVGMGSSLADGAWDRETAVYRITGVLAVISGWFLTAFTAFIASGFNAWLCLVLGPAFMVIAGLIVIGLLVYTNFCTKTPIEETEQKAIACLTKEELRRRLNNSIGNNLQETVRIFSESVDVFLAEDYNAIKAKKLEAQSLLDKISFLRSQYFQMVAEKKNGECDYDARNYYYRTFSNMKDVAQFLRNTVGQMEQHLANSHSVFEGKLRENLLRSVEELASLQKELDSFIRTGSENDEVLLKLTKNSLEEVNVFQLDLMKAVDHQKIPLHRSELYLSLLQFSREVVNRYTVIVLLQRELNMILSEDASISVVTTVQA